MSLSSGGFNSDAHPPPQAVDDESPIRRSLVRVQVGEPEFAGATLRGGPLHFGDVNLVG